MTRTEYYPTRRAAADTARSLRGWLNPGTMRTWHPDTGATVYTVYADDPHTGRRVVMRINGRME